jgi:glycosyltransferase involved in cell wall biosynthesis
MHIGILSQASNFHCQKWAKALQKAGNQVTVFTLENYDIKDVPCISLLKNQNEWSYLDFYFTKNKLKEVIKSEKIDVLHPLHLTPYGVWGYWTDFQPMVPAAMGADVFEYIPSQVIPELKYRSWNDKHEKKNLVNSFKKIILKKYHRYMVKQVTLHAKYITADNQTLINALFKYFQVSPKKLFLQRWGLDEEIFHAIPEENYEKTLLKFGLNTSKPIILSPRGLMPIYNGDIILKSFENLVKKYNQFQWVMMSAGYVIPSHLKPVIQDLENQYAHFRCIQQQICREEMAVIWKHTKIFISVPIYDGYSAAVAEGRYVGAIPIVNDIPGNREVIQHLENGIIVHPLNIKNLTQNLEFVIENLETLYEKFKIHNQNWIKKYGLLNQDAQRFTNFLTTKL